MPEIVVFLAEQSALVRAALYITSLLSLAAVGGLALSLLIEALDAVGGALSANRDWETLSAVSSKEDVLQLFALAVYGSILITIEPPIRTLASTVGTVLVASLILAPIAGLIALSMRKPASAG